MFTKEAIQQLSQAEQITNASEAITKALDHKDGCVALPDTLQLHDLEKYQDLRRRARGLMKTSCIPDFAKYVVAQRDDSLQTTIFVGRDTSAKAVLNLGTTTAPGHADNIALLQLQPTAAFSALTKINGNHISQKTAVEFLEDWIDLVQFFSTASDSPSVITKGSALQALRKLTIEAARKVESVSANFKETMSAFESVEASSTLTLPDLVYFSCVPYEGLSERSFVLRLSVITGDDKPKLCLRIRQMEQHEDQMSAELMQLVETALHEDSNVTVLRGQYERSN